jgi:5'(3')-deoxyribonucleotidase
MFRVFIDMDGVLANFDKAYKEKWTEKMQFPQATQGFFESLEPIKYAVSNYRYLAYQYDVRIATAPSVMNPLCYTEKRLWVEKHLGMQAAERMIIIPDKSLLIGDILIDDNTEGKGQESFQGTLLKFYNWQDTLNDVRIHFQNS